MGAGLIGKRHIEHILARPGPAASGPKAHRAFDQVTYANPSSARFDAGLVSPVTDFRVRVLSDQNRH
jgi:hypothetical protein